MNKIWNEYPEIRTKLVDVKNIIETNLKSRNKFIETALNDLLNGEGKFLRPSFVIIASEFGTKKDGNINTLAAVMEMIHMATLVHDDIIDESELRRGKETVQHKYGRHFAVYVGDYLFTVCFKLLSKTSSIKNIEIDSNSMARICLGEIEQYSSKFNNNVTVKQYLKRISYKTAELFSLSFYTGALESGCNERLAKKLSYIGHNIGMAFQIIDDMLDFFGDEKTIGKPVCSDLRQGLFTLPVILGLRSKNSQLAAVLSKNLYSDSDINYIIDLLKDLGAFEMTKSLADDYTKKAFKLIDALPDCSSKLILKDLTKKLLTREF